MIVARNRERSVERPRVVLESCCIRPHGGRVEIMTDHGCELVIHRDDRDTVRHLDHVCCTTDQAGRLRELRRPWQRLTGRAPTAEGLDHLSEYRASDGSHFRGCG
jgi:hypothetical protein